MDEANKIERRTTPRSKPRGQQCDNARQLSNFNTVVPLSFADESEDRPPPPPRDTYMQTSVVDHGRQSTQANRNAASRPSTSAPVVSGARPIPCLLLAVTQHR